MYTTNYLNLKFYLHMLPFVCVYRDSIFSNKVGDSHCNILLCIGSLSFFLLYSRCPPWQMMKKQQHEFFIQSDHKPHKVNNEKKYVYEMFYPELLRTLCTSHQWATNQKTEFNQTLFALTSSLMLPLFSKQVPSLSVLPFDWYTLITLRRLRINLPLTILYHT